jgi:hypothetical protein
MTVKLLTHSDEGRMNALKSPQHSFSCGTLRRPFGIARIQACQALLGVSQPLAHPKLQQGQDAQSVMRENTAWPSTSAAAVRDHGI